MKKYIDVEKAVNDFTLLYKDVDISFDDVIAFLNAQKCECLVSAVKCADCRYFNSCNTRPHGSRLTSDGGWYCADGEQSDCSSYHYGRCYGTKEIDECTCKGERRNCDFYEEVRNKAVANEQKRND